MEGGGGLRKITKDREEILIQPRSTTTIDRDVLLMPPPLPPRRLTPPPTPAPPAQTEAAATSSPPPRSDLSFENMPSSIEELLEFGTSPKRSADQAFPPHPQVPEWTEGAGGDGDDSVLGTEVEDILARTSMTLQQQEEPAAKKRKKSGGQGNISFNTLRAMPRMIIEPGGIYSTTLLASFFVSFTMKWNHNKMKPFRSVHNKMKVHFVLSTMK